MLDKFKQSDFTKKEVRRVIAEIIMHKITNPKDEVSDNKQRRYD